MEPRLALVQCEAVVVMEGVGEVLGVAVMEGFTDAVALALPLLLGLPLPPVAVPLALVQPEALPPAALTVAPAPGEAVPASKVPVAHCVTVALTVPLALDKSEALGGAVAEGVALAVEESVALSVAVADGEGEMEEVGDKVEAREAVAAALVGRAEEEGQEEGVAEAAAGEGDEECEGDGDGEGVAHVDGLPEFDMEEASVSVEANEAVAAALVGRAEEEGQEEGVADAGAGDGDEDGEAVGDCKGVADVDGLPEPEMDEAPVSVEAKEAVAAALVGRAEEEGQEEGVADAAAGEGDEDCEGVGDCEGDTEVDALPESKRDEVAVSDEAKEAVAAALVGAGEEEGQEEGVGVAAAGVGDED